MKMLLLLYFFIMFVKKKIFLYLKVSELQTLMILPKICCMSCLVCPNVDFFFPTKSVKFNPSQIKGPLFKFEQTNIEKYTHTQN